MRGAPVARHSSDPLGELNYRLRSRQGLKWLALCVYAALASTLIWGAAQLGI